MSDSIVSTFVDTNSSSGVSLLSLCSVIQRCVSKVIYVKSNMTYAVTMDEWKQMWTRQSVTVKDQVQSQELPAWAISGSDAVVVWIFRKDALDAVV